MKCLFAEQKKRINDNFFAKLLAQENTLMYLLINEETLKRYTP